MILSFKTLKGALEVMIMNTSVAIEPMVNLNRKILVHKKDDAFIGENTIMLEKMGVLCISFPEFRKDFLREAFMEFNIFQESICGGGKRTGWYIF